MANNKLILRSLKSPWITPIPDFTKGSVLTHDELDNNLIYLRGEVIYDATSSSGFTTLHKINGQTLTYDNDQNNLIDEYIFSATSATTIEDVVNEDLNGITINDKTNVLIKLVDGGNINSYLFASGKGQWGFVSGGQLVTSNDFVELPSGSGSLNQNNLVDAIDVNLNTPFDGTHTISEAVNMYPTFIVDELTNLVIRTSQAPGRGGVRQYSYGFYLLKPGKGTYGSGGTVLTDTDFEHIGTNTTAITNPNPIIYNPDAIVYTISGYTGNTIEDAVDNYSLETYIINNIDDVYFEIELAGVMFVYRWIGNQPITIGNGGTPTTDNDYLEFYNEFSTDNGYWTSGSSGNFSVKTINDSGLDATGDYSLASGYNTLASGDYSHVGGFGTIASGNYSLSIGENNTSSGIRSATFGKNNTNNIVNGLIFGDGHISTDSVDNSSGNVVGGEFNTLNNNLWNSAIFGWNNRIGTVGAGYDESVVYQSINVGYDNDMYAGHESAMFGAALSGGAHACTIVGVANEDLTENISNFTTSEHNLPNPRFIVGNGVYDDAFPGTVTSRSNAFVVMHSGEVIAPDLSITKIDSGDDRSLVTKEWVESNNGSGSLWTTGSTGNFSLKVINDTTTDATGDYSTASGYNTLASGTASYAGGFNTYAIGIASDVSGIGTFSRINAETVVGRYNTVLSYPLEMPYPASFSERLFNVGNGDDGNRSDAFGIFKNGHVLAPSLTINHISTGDTKILITKEYLNLVTPFEFNQTGGTSSIQTVNGDTEATGNYSLAIGRNTTASGHYSFAMGNGSTASAPYSFAIGYNTVSNYYGGFAHGYQTTASGGQSVATGGNTTASGYYSTASGYQNTSSTYGEMSIGIFGTVVSATTNSYEWNAEDRIFNIGIGQGDGTRADALQILKSGHVMAPTLSIPSITTGDTKMLITKEYLDTVAGTPLWSGGSGTDAIKTIAGGNIASGDNSLAWGVNSLASGTNSTASGYNTKATGYTSTASGYLTTASGTYSTAMGMSTTAAGTTATASGRYSTASGHYSSASGYYADAAALGAQATGRRTTADGEYSTASGSYTTASGNYSNASGYGTTASGAYSHAEGYNTTASDYYSHAEGYRTTASAYASHAEGSNTTASGLYSHAEGNTTIASGDYSHAEGAFYVDVNPKVGNVPTRAIGIASHAEGGGTQATGDYSHSEGYRTTASGIASHVEGQNNSSSGDYSHAGGIGNTAQSYGETRFGTYSITTSPSTGSSTTFISDDPLFVVGNGEEGVGDSDALRIIKNGTVLAPSLTTDLINDSEFTSKVMITREYINNVNDISGTSVTATTLDSNSTLVLGDAAAVSLTIPLNATDPIPVGSTYKVVNNGVGTITVGVEVGVTLLDDLVALTLLTGAVRSLQKLDTDLWVMY